jgi:hypothetical protein
MDTRTTPLPALCARLLWMMVGPITLMLLAFQLTQQRQGWLSATTAAYFLVLGGTVFGRWMEFRSGLPMTVTGEPATTGHLHRYSLAAGAIGAVIWLAANLVGSRAW